MRTTSRAALEKYFPVLFRGNNGLVAHECIIDLREFKAVTARRRGEAPDRLLLPRADAQLAGSGTLMIEPTESETKTGPLLRSDDHDPRGDHAIETGEADKEQNVLKLAPHTARGVRGCVGSPVHPRAGRVSRGLARQHKFWPAVGRVDNVWGDRNLFCSCVPMEAFGE